GVAVLKIDPRQFSHISTCRIPLSAAVMLLLPNASLSQTPIPLLPKIPPQLLQSKERAQPAPGVILPGTGQSGDARERTGQPPPDVAEITSAEDWHIDGGTIHARNVKVNIGEYVLTGARLDGNIDTEIVFSGGATLEFRGQTITGDTIRFSPKTKSFKVENLHTAITPEFLQGRLQTPLYVSGESIFGQRNKP